QPVFIFGIELQRSRPAPQRHALSILAHLFAKLQESFSCVGITRSPAPFRPPDVENPIHPAHLERAVMTYSVATEPGPGARRYHRRQPGRIGQRQRMLRAPWVGRAHRSHTTIGPPLRADPFQRVEPVGAVVAERSPFSFRTIPAAHVLSDGDVSARNKIARPAFYRLLTIRRSLQDDR